MTATAGLSGPPLDLEHGVVDLGHGSGGRAMHRLIAQVFAARFDNPYLAQGNDQALLPARAERMVVTTDTFVVSPLFFPGGDIGSLAVHGTINDLAVGGAQPAYLTAGFVLEEGLPLADLRRIAAAMAAAAAEAGVPVVAGDTKVVERGKGDGLFINTTGIGYLADGLHLSGDRARPGDAILLSGTIADHGVAVLGCRSGLGLSPGILSDSAPLNGLVRDMLATAPDIRCMRDPTRGGLGSTLNELAAQCGAGMRVDEAAIPVRPDVQAACELLGLDPLYVANEGKLVAVCPPEQAAGLLAAMRRHPAGHAAAIIGEVLPDPDRFVVMKTAFGGTRVVDWPAGIQLPRIC